MATEELTYDFREEGLDQLRSDMEALTESTEDLGDEAASTAGEMDAAASSMEESLEDVEDAVERLQDALNSISTRRAQRALEGIEDAAEDVEFDAMANNAIQASAAIESAVEDVEDALVGAGIAGLEAGEAIAAGARSGTEEYEELTQQVLAAKAAIGSMDGSGPETPAAQQQPTTGGGDGALGAVALGVGLKQILEDSSAGGDRELTAVRDAVEKLQYPAAELSQAGSGLGDAAAELRGAARALKTSAAAGSGGSGGGSRAPGNERDYGDDDGGFGGPPNQRDDLGAIGGDDGDDGSSMRRTSSLFGALNRETHGLLGGMKQWVASLSTSTKAIAGTTTAATLLTASLSATAAGLAALATGLATQFGDEDIKRDLEIVRAQFRDTAQMFVDQFEPIIRGEVIPLLQSWNQWLQESIDNLAAFTRRTWDEAESLGAAFLSVGRAIGSFFDLLQGLGVIGLVTNLFQGLADIITLMANSVDYVLESLDSLLHWIWDQIGFDGNQDGQQSMGDTAPRPAERVTPNAENEDTSATTGSRAESGPNPAGELNQAITSMNRAVERAKGKFERGLIDKEQMLKSIAQARSTAFGKIQKLSQRYPDLVSESLLGYMTEQILDARDRLGDFQLKEATEQPADATKVEGADPTSRYPVKTPGQIAGMGSSLQPVGGGLSALKSAAEAASSVGDINRLIEATRAKFDTLNNDEARDFIGVLQKAKDKMQETKSEAKLIGDALARSVARSADRVFDALGEAVSGAIFGGGGGRSTAQAELNLFNAKEQMSSLRKTLRKGNISYRKFALRMKVQQNKIQKRQEQLNDSMQSGFAQAAESMVSAFKKVAKQLIAEITAVVAKMAVLKAITSAFSIGSGGFLGSVIGNLGGGAFLDSGASGGMVKQSGLAVIHENEQIMNAETVSALGDLLQPSTPSAQPAMTGGGGMEVTVNVTGETTTDGRDLKTSYDKTARIQRRKGRK
ncbi:hypothetical protein [Salinibacter ruber]|uniref:hypothetical protein n=1 Tax=Salinibacter ruber TaxID=146919 RepID=UPI00207443DE|nr:hypothetical protein [Salinibacter ruber]